MKNFVRRLKIDHKRFKHFRSPVLRRTETSLFALLGASLVALLARTAISMAGIDADTWFPKTVENTLYRIHIASVFGLWALWILLYLFNSRERRSALAARLRLGLWGVVLGLVLIYIPSTTIAYFKAFPDLPQQLETDAYLQEHAEPMTRSVDHFLEKLTEGKVVASDGSEDDIELSIGDRLSHLMLSRTPLVLKTWAGEITPEDARRHVLWHYADLKHRWIARMENPTENSLPADAAHPGFFMLSCLETRDGLVLVAPWFAGAPSADASHPNYVAHSEDALRPQDKPGMIQVPTPLFDLDVSGIDYMKPLAKVCQDMRPDFK